MNENWESPNWGKAQLDENYEGQRGGTDSELENCIVVIKEELTQMENWG